MSWFRKKLNEEIHELIKKLSYSKKLLSKEWTWRDSKVKSLQQLEDLDLKIVKNIRKLHALVKDNPKVYDRIMFLARELKTTLEPLIQLKNLSSASINKKKVLLAEAIISELQALLREEVEEERLIRGMTKKQAEKLGVEVESFYTVQDEDDFKRLLHGKGTWPILPTKAHLGPGLYAFDNIKSARRYKEIIRKKARNNGQPDPKLLIVQVSFSKRSLNDFKPFDVDLLDNIKDGESQEWMKKHSRLWNNKPEKHNQKYVIRGVSANLGREHYFRPECLEEAAIELVH